MGVKKVGSMPLLLTPFRVHSGSLAADFVTIYMVFASLGADFVAMYVVFASLGADF